MAIKRSSVQTNSNQLLTGLKTFHHPIDKTVNTIDGTCSSSDEDIRLVQQEAKRFSQQNLSQSSKDKVVNN